MTASAVDHGLFVIDPPHSHEIDQLSSQQNKSKGSIPSRSQEPFSLAKYALYAVVR
jgi:hypothetical protein